MYCQKCRTPIRLDDSLEHLNPASFKILIGTSSEIHHWAVTHLICRLGPGPQTSIATISKDDCCEGAQGTLR